MSSISFVDPPTKAQGPGGGHWQSIVKELRANPNKWALVGTSSSNGLGYHVVKKYPDIERTVRSTTDGNWDIYMRAVSA
jgi:hypothetical protein